MAKARLYLSQRMWAIFKEGQPEDFRSIPAMAHGFGLKTPVQIYVYSMDEDPPPVAQLHDDLTLEILNG